MSIAHMNIQDPDVRAWAEETGVAPLRTSVQLQCRNKARLEAQIAQLRATFGESLTMRDPRPNGRGGWIAFGSVVS